MQKAALYTFGVVFATVAVAHVVRLTTGVGIVVDGVILPVWVPDAAPSGAEGRSLTRSGHSLG